MNHVRRPSHESLLVSRFRAVVFTARNHAQREKSFSCERPSRTVCARNERKRTAREDDGAPCCRWLAKVRPARRFSEMDATLDLRCCFFVLKSREAIKRRAGLGVGALKAVRRPSQNASLIAGIACAFIGATRNLRFHGASQGIEKILDVGEARRGSFPEERVVIQAFS